MDRVIKPNSLCFQSITSRQLSFFFLFTNKTTYPCVLEIQKHLKKPLKIVERRKQKPKTKKANQKSNVQNKAV